jgi:hypothetical protein
MCLTFLKLWHLTGWTDRYGEADRRIFATFPCECTRNDVVVVVVMEGG